MTFEDLDDTYGFMYDKEGCLIQYDAMLTEVIEADNEDRAWTVLDIDGELHVVQGLYYVNRFSHLISERPCTGIIHSVPFED